MRGHKGQVRSLAVEPETGELLASGGEDGTVRIWYIPTGRCLRTFHMSAPVTSVAYCPNTQYTLLLVSCESNVVTLLNAECGDKLRISSTRQYVESLDLPSESSDGEVKWNRNAKTNSVEITLPDKIRQATWHAKGDYFATVGFEASAKTVYIHQLSKANSQKPFSKKKGHIQRVLFHPTLPQFFVATQQHIRVYDLAKCQLQKKLFSGSKSISCMQLDTHGNNLFVGGLDRTFSWIDLELSAKPCKSLKNHGAAVRSLSYHGRYPLLATVSDDATAIVYHARIPQDLMRDNELVPVKRLFAHKLNAKKTAQEEADANGTAHKHELAILATMFHPTQPWLITAGADGLIGLFSY
jgi:ribosome biogenesis protein ERB1